MRLRQEHSILLRTRQVADEILRKTKTVEHIHMRSRSPRSLRIWTAPILDSTVSHTSIGLVLLASAVFTPACQAHKGLVCRWPRRGRLRLNARIDERVDDGRALRRHATRAQAPPQRLLMAHHLLRNKVLGKS